MLEKKFKKGKYYIGDPCYVVPNQDEWINLLESTDYFSDNGLENKQQYKGYSILAGSTAYGDGVYYDNEDREYCVDAGLIGIMPIECIDIDVCPNIYDVGNIVEFAYDFTATIDNGIFTFDSIVINTEEDDDEDGYYY